MTHLSNLLLLTAAALAGCAAEAVERDGDGRDDAFASGKADTGGIGEGTPEALAVLRVANEETAASLQLHGVVKRAAENIVGVRFGDDGQEGTADDAAYLTLAELDAVPFVGPHAFARLLELAESLGYLTPAPVTSPPPDLWNVAACPRVTWAKLVSLFATGETRFDTGRQYATAGRRRTGCNTVTGCTPWQEGGTLFNYQPGGVAVRSESRGHTRLEIVGTTSMKILMSSDEYPDLWFHCGGLGVAGSSTPRCHVSSSGGSVRYSAEMNGDVYVEGTVCADGRFHLVSALGEEDSNAANNLIQIAVYGWLF